MKAGFTSDEVFDSYGTHTAATRRRTVNIITFNNSLGKSFPLFRPSRLPINCVQDIFLPMFCGQQQQQQQQGNKTLREPWRDRVSPGFLSVSENWAEVNFLWTENFKQGSSSLRAQSLPRPLGGGIAQLVSLPRLPISARLLIRISLSLYFRRAPSYEIGSMRFMAYNIDPQEK